MLPASMSLNVQAQMILSLLFLTVPVRSYAQTKPQWTPPELQVIDPDIKALLNDPSANCDKLNISDTIEKLKRALTIAERRALLRDRAIVQATLAAAYINTAQIDLAFITFQKALQDAIDSKNQVLEADILLSVDAEAQMNGDTNHALELASRALQIAETVGSLYEKARALGEIGRLRLVSGKYEEAQQPINEAIDIDQLNGYKFEALHLIYRGQYFGLTGQLDQAVKTLNEAKVKALAANEPYMFVSAETTYTFALVKQGTGKSAVNELNALMGGDLRTVVSDPQQRTCLGSALTLPTIHIMMLEGLANALEAANEKEQELAALLELYSSGKDHSFAAAQAEAAQKIGEISTQLKKPEDAVKYYAIAEDLYRQLQNEAAVEQIEYSHAVLLINLGRGKEAISLINGIIAYAKRHQIRQLEFTGYLQLGEIYQPARDIANARTSLETAESLIQPRPFDSELDNHEVLELYIRLSNVYRALNSPPDELLAIENAVLVAVHLKDEENRKQQVAYLDQRIKELQIRTQVGERQRDGQLAESLLYSYLLYFRDGFPSKPTDDQSNWQRMLTIPFQLAQQPSGAAALVEILHRVGPFGQFEQLPVLNALERYYIASGADAALAEKYALQAENVLQSLKVELLPAKIECACVLAVAYSRQGKVTLANQKVSECVTLANRTEDAQTIAYSQAANAMVQLQNGDLAAARNSLEKMIEKAPNDPELRIELAMSLASKKLYDESFSQLRAATDQLKVTGDKKTAAGAYVRVAIALNSDDSPRAHTLQLNYFTRAAQIYKDLGEQGEQARVFNAVGEYYLKLSDVDTAVTWFKDSYQLATKANREDIAAQACSDLGNAYQKQKDFTRARDFHEKAAQKYLRLKIPLPRVLSLEGLAEDYEQLNETDKALTAFLDAKASAAEIPPYNQYFLDYFLAEFYRRQGEFENSLATFRDAVQATAQANDPLHCAYAHLGIAELDGLIGTWEDAVQESEAALKLFEQVGDKTGQATAWAMLTNIYSDRGSSLKNFSKAQECYAKAEELGYGETLDLDLMEIYLQTGEYGKAEQIARKNVEHCVKEKDEYCQAHALLSLSEAQRLNREIKSARSTLNQARPIASKSQDVYLRGRLLYAESRQLNSEHKLEQSLSSYKALIALIEGVKGKLDAREQKSLAENYGYIYDELVSLLYSMARVNPREQTKFASESLKYAEINKAKQFTQSWGRAFISEMQRSLPAAVQERERALFSKLDRLTAELQASEVSASAKSNDIKRDLAAAEVDIGKFLVELRINAPQYAAVAYPEDVQMSALPLRAGDSLVEFKMTNDATFVWLIQNQNGSANELVSFYKIERSREWFLNQISALRGGLNSGYPEAINWEISENLFKALFPEDVRTALSRSKSIIFIPDDVLFTLPIEVFSPTATKQAFFFLGKATTYYPSAVSFRLARTAIHQTKWEEGFLGVADPITSSEDDRYAALKANGATPQISTRTSAMSAQTDPPLESTRLKARGFIFERLPATAAEVRDIALLIQKSDEPVEIRVGADATKTELLDTDLSRFRFLHFATHGVLPVDTNLKEPALVLSYDGVSPTHMFLSMSEILGLKLQSESVVLSACNTGSGKISRAEGVMSLGRAFLAAGAASVTVSLWQVSDESTAALMKQYYRGVLAGKPKNVALAEARQALSSGPYKNPFYWGPFILIGE